MKPFWTEDLVYDSVLGIGNYTGFPAWFRGELKKEKNKTQK